MEFGPNTVLTYGQIVGAVLRSERTRRGLTQQACAHAIDLKQGSYSRLERGEVVLSVGQLQRLGELVGAPASLMLLRADVVVEFAQGAGWRVESNGAAPCGAASIAALVERALAQDTESSDTPST